MKTMIKNNDIILFQGDSITDCGRSRDSINTPNDLCALGQGYPMMAAAQLLSTKPAARFQFFNRGISGNRIVDLYARMKSDLINLKPNIVSILIGVNDTWHEHVSQNGVEVLKYERIYRDLLSEVREDLPEVQFVLCEPFVLKCGVVTDEWVVEIDQRRAVVAKLAQEYDATLIRFQSMFDQAVKGAHPIYWAADGVHPTAAGHMLMAQNWLQQVALIVGEENRKP